MQLQFARPQRLVTYSCSYLDVRWYMLCVNGHPWCVHLSWMLLLRQCVRLMNLINYLLYSLVQLHIELYICIDTPCAYSWHYQ